MLKTISLILSLIVFLSVLWIVVRAPAYQLWLFSVAASEWSLWLGGVALIGIIFSLYFPIFGGNGKLWILSFSLSFIALLISLYPLFSVWKLASEQNVSLSFGEYFGGFLEERSVEDPFTTHKFSTADDKPLNLDVYLPTVKNKNNGASVIVIHGGSWNAGKRNDFPQWNRWLAGNGFTVFDIDYRIAPQPNYKTATGDIKCAIGWIKANGGNFNIANDRIVLFGRSAGGHLALLAGYSEGVSELPSGCTENVQTETVQAIISFYAPTDMLWAYDNPANEFVINGKETLSAFLGGDPHSSEEVRKRYELATPLSHISAQTPPTLIFHGGKDQLVRTENMEFLDKKLNEFRVAHEMIFIPYGQHGFDYNIHGWGSQIAKPTMLKFLVENTKNKN